MSSLESPAAPPSRTILPFSPTTPSELKAPALALNTLLYEYIHNAKTAEAIASQFPTVSLAQVYATILYYLQNKAAIGQYLSDWLDYTLAAEAEQDNNPDPGIPRVKTLKAFSAA